MEGRPNWYLYTLSLSERYYLKKILSEAERYFLKLKDTF